MSEPRFIDARGLRCPWPVLRLSRIARDAGAVGSVEILADDPIAPSELRQLCEERGWRFEQGQAEHSFTVWLDR